MSPSEALLASAALVAVAGCAPIATVNADGTIAHHYIGYVKVIVPPSVASSESVHALDVSSIGLQVRDGVGVGYFRDSRVAVPLDCRLVVLVRTQEQLERAIEILKPMKGDGLCATVYRQ